MFSEKEKIINTNLLVYFVFLKNLKKSLNSSLFADY